MTIAQLDAIFPYVCFFYGALMTVTLSLPALERIADQRLAPDLVRQWRGHRGLALFCLVIGGLWILQNLWLA